MDSLPWESVVSVLGFFLTLAVAVWEFALKGRKRLGYRVQMDTTATNAVRSNDAGAWTLLRRDGNGAELKDPSFVLLRIENNGLAHIDEDDYGVPADVPSGIRVRFPDRRVAGMVVTELSHSSLRTSFEGVGLRLLENEIRLPKVPLNRRRHYKVLVALERSPDLPGLPPGQSGQYPDPEVIGEVKGGFFVKTRSGTSPWARILIGVLALTAVGQFAVALGAEDATPAPMDCASGHVTLIGSTAFRAVLSDAADAYEEVCPDASFTLDTEGSLDGRQRLDGLGARAAATTVAFSDGTAAGAFPRLVPRPVALMLFTLVVHESNDVRDLTLGQVRRIYEGELTDWRQVTGRGPSRPIHLISRDPDSGTRTVFEERVLGGAGQGDDNSHDCRVVNRGERDAMVRCEQDSTSEQLDAVAAVPDALGYSEVGTASRRDGVAPIRIDGQRPTLEAADQGGYPFWETEYAYTVGEPEPGSLVASFLRYLANERGRDIIRFYGHRACTELANPQRCQPE